MASELYAQRRIALQVLVAHEVHQCVALPLKWLREMDPVAIKLEELLLYIHREHWALHTLGILWTPKYALRQLEVGGSLVIVISDK